VCLCPSTRVRCAALDTGAGASKDKRGWKDKLTKLRSDLVFAPSHRLLSDIEAVYKASMGEFD
jgi:hypothetical protein